MYTCGELIVPLSTSLWIIPKVDFRRRSVEIRVIRFWEAINSKFLTSQSCREYEKYVVSFFKTILLARKIINIWNWFF